MIPMLSKHPPRPAVPIASFNVIRTQAVLLLLHGELKNTVGKARDDDILHHLLPQAVASAEQLALVEKRLKLPRGLLGGLRVLSKGILNDETHPAQAGPLHRPLADASARVQKGGGWQGQVEETVSALLQ
ncbi:uncharacterized protein Tco025E_08779, partial [Trypanosoma conorhini]